MNLAVLTSVETRHRYFARRLHEALGVKAVVYEHIGYSPAATESYDLTPDEERIIREHFADRARQEARYFGHSSEPFSRDDGVAVQELRSGQLNAPKSIAFLAEAGVDTIAVFGTNLIKPPLLTRYAGRCINLHLGLSPYYRGTATNFYPLLNEEPEYVGATIHLIDAGIDSGPIFAHALPEIVADDGPHTIGCKAIAAGIEMMIEVLRRFGEGTIEPVPQWSEPHARLHLRKDYHPRQVVDLHRKLSSGLIRRYVLHAKERAGRFRLVTLRPSADIRPSRP